MNYNILYAAIGSAIGGGLRYWIAGAMHRYFPLLFPIGTLTVNFIGSFIVGLVIFYLDVKQLVNPQMKIFLTVGVCGGLTTFSTFSFETFALLQQNEIFQALLNVLLNILLTIGAIFLAYFISKIFSGA
jgi:CrcB protein